MMRPVQRAFAVTLASIVPSTCLADTLYYGTNGAIYSLSLPDTTSTLLQEQAIDESNSGLAVHPTEGLLYWTGKCFPCMWTSLYVSPLSGAGVTVLATRTGNSEEYWFRGVAVDVVAGRVYWTELVNGGVVWSANLDGSQITPVISSGAGNELWGLAVDASAGRIYWTTESPGRVRRADVNGENIEDILTGLTAPRGVALDLARGYLYCADYDTGKIIRATLAGDNPVEVVGNLELPFGVAVDSASGRIYWAEFFTGQVRSANSDGSDVQTLISGIIGPRYIAFVRDPVPVPAQSHIVLGLTTLLLVVLAIAAIARMTCRAT